MFSLPPFGLLLLIGVGLVSVSLGRRRLGLGLAWFSMAVFYLLSTELVSARLTTAVEGVSVLSPSEVSAIDAEAIIILGAGANPYNPELDRPAASFRSLFRLRYGAYLHRQTELPILVSGGKSRRHPTSLGRILADDLNQSFGVPVRWIEDRSTNTFENAAFTAEVLRAAGVERAFLVTEAFHMRRAMEAFATTDLEIIPAPTGQRPEPKRDLWAFLPSMNSLADSYFAIHELLGRAWYALRYGT